MSRIATLVVLVVPLIATIGCKKGAQFKEFSSAEGRFKVLMPGAPKEQAQAAGPITMKNFMIEEKDGAYMASFAELPIAANEPDAMTQQRLDGSRDGALRNTNAKLKKESKITLAGKYPGREIEADLPGGKGIVRARVWIVNQRLYMVQVIGTAAWASSNDANKFLDSFTLIQ